MFKISQIFVYPVKSLPGIALQSAEFNEKGILHDREWMLVDEQNKFISQRQYEKLVHCHVEIADTKLIFTIEKSKIDVPFSAFHIPEKGTVWTDQVDILKTDSIINQVFSDFLGIKCNLVKTADTTLRKEKYNQGKVRFSDRYPVLVTNTVSLNYLNTHFPENIFTLNFRPNIVFEGSEPFEEEHWNVFQVGNVTFHKGEPCKRCIMINIDQKSGKVNKSNFKNLKEIRGEKGAVFGLLCSPKTAGKININDILKVL